MEPIFQRTWAAVNISVTAYLHQLMNYRYHWHENEYELDIVLTGRAEFVRGDENFTLESGDIILINPGAGHASFSLVEGTSAMVIRISQQAFVRFLSLGQRYQFDYVTDFRTRDSVPARKIRYYGTLLLRSLQGTEVTAETKSRAALEMLSSVIVDQVPSRIIPYQKEDLFHQQAVRVITTYMEANYYRKITLDDLAHLTKYNRTYISTIFRDTVGIRFYDYLIRIRITNALYELADTSKTLTDVAMDNGFPDLKNFNKKFKEAIHITPARYRFVIQEFGGEFVVRKRHYYMPDDALVKPVLDGYEGVFDVAMYQ